MKKVKKRSINEYRQVKDSIYYPPLSHYKHNSKKIKDASLYHLMQAHDLLRESYGEKDRDELLSQIEYMIVKLSGVEPT